MKKHFAIAAALIISLHYFTSAIPAIAGQTESSIVDDDVLQEENPVTPEKSEAKDCGLQIPQKLDIFLDPWEINGKGQIYSETYVIRNTGEETVDISLYGIVCIPGKNSGTQIKTSEKGLYENKKKNLYMEMVIDGRTKITMSEKGSEYQTRLDPGESLPVYFTGALNGDSSKEWKDGDIRISMKCSWSVEKEELMEERIEKIDEQTEDTGEVSPVVPAVEDVELDSLHIF